MKRSIRWAAKAHNLALVFLLVGIGAFVVVEVIKFFFPKVGLGALEGLLGFLLFLAVGTIFVTGFHIAVTEALQRIERSEKETGAEGGRLQKPPTV